MSHTPATWQISKPSKHGVMHTVWRNDEGPNSDAETNTNYARICRDIENPYDASLIAAAPELLGLLKEAVLIHEDNFDYSLGGDAQSRQWLMNARNIISKAESRPT